MLWRVDSFQGMAFKEARMPNLHAEEKQKSKYVAEKLGLIDVASDSFIKLCEKDCDPEFLGEYFKFLTSPPEITYQTSKSKQRKVNIRSLDSIESALGGFDKRDLEPLRHRLKKLLKDIEKLNTNRIIRYAAEEEFEKCNEVSSLPNLISIYADEYIPFLLGCVDISA